MASVLRALLLLVLALAVLPSAKAEEAAVPEQAASAVPEPAAVPATETPVSTEAPAVVAPAAAPAPVPAAVIKAKAPKAAPAKTAPLPERAIGKSSAPVKIDEYSSLTCSHCADFFLKTLPEIQKRYVDTGKVRIVMHDFPLNGISLKAAAVAHCMPEDVYFPFIKTLYGALEGGALDSTNFEATLYQYAALGGLPVDKAKACAADTKLQDAIVADRTQASTKYGIEATPTFVINNGADIINGAVSIDTFAAAIERQLTAKK